MSSGYRGDLTVRVLGAIIFLVGIGLLGFLFYLAYGFFKLNSEQALDLVFTGNPKLDPPAMKVGLHFGWAVLKIATLFVMAIAGSVLSQKGINLYFSAVKGSAVNVMPHVNASPPTG